jgi:hypothetical protein
LSVAEARSVERGNVPVDAFENASREAIRSVDDLWLMGGIAQGQTVNAVRGKMLATAVALPLQQWVVHVSKRHMAYHDVGVGEEACLFVCVSGSDVVYDVAVVVVVGMVVATVTGDDCLGVHCVLTVKEETLRPPITGSFVTCHRVSDPEVPSNAARTTVSGDSAGKMGGAIDRILG